MIYRIMHRDGKRVLFEGGDTVKEAVALARKARANLSWADLSRADLREVDLEGADLSWADLSRANLSGANLEGADLEGADLSEAIGVIDLGQRTDGYRFMIQRFDDHAKIKAGCRYMPVVEARKHRWSIPAESLARIEMGVALARAKCWTIGDGT